MFAKRVKKTFPDGTFIPKTARVLSILQLCLAFTALIWNASLPFMGHLYTLKSKSLLYQTVMGKKELANQIGKDQDPVYLATLKRNEERFLKLPEINRTALIEHYALLQKKMQTPFIEKLKQSIALLLFYTPAFEQAWIVFAIAIPIFILLRIEGALQAIWLLPLLALFFSIDNRQNGSQSQNDEANFFPREEVIVTRYLNEPLSSSIFEQQRQLKLGWQTYLIHEWAKETPSNDDTVFQRQAENGEFLFHVARLKKLAEIDQENAFVIQERKSTLLLSFYIFWNLCFAFFVHQSMRKDLLIA